MNERIRELSKQAEILITEAGAFHNTPQGAYQLQEQHMNKFADLVVKECADIALKSGNIANKNIAAKIESERIYHKIKEHFGVEE